MHDSAPPFQLQPEGLMARAIRFDALGKEPKTRGVYRAL